MSAVRFEQLRLAEEVGRFGTFSWNVDENSVIWSPGMYRLLNLPVTVAANFDLYMSMVVPKDHDRVLDVIVTAGAAREPYHHENQLQPAGTGHSIWVAARGQFSVIAGVPTIFGVLTDISEQMEDRARMVELIDQLRATVTSSQDLLRLLSMEREARPAIE